MKTPSSSDDRRWIDLHLHSTASDGAHAPARLMEMAHARHLACVALTDHDTVGGVAEAAEAAEQIGIEFVPGVELSATHGRGALHILGYYVDPTSPSLQQALAWMVEQREARNQAIIARLMEQGVQLDYAAIREDACTEAVGRPHIAQAMVRVGAVATFRSAFKKYLGDGASAWVAPAQFSAEEVIATIRSAGGVATLAHPSQLGCKSHLELATLLRRLVDAGLGAIEVYHPIHTRQQTRFYLEMGERFNLAITGGSDFHALGGSLPRGAGFCSVRVPYTLLEGLRSLAGGKVRDHC